jgi:hypothetical protein
MAGGAERNRATVPARRCLSSGAPTPLAPARSLDWKPEYL